MVSIGLCAGILVSTFSRPLALLIGLMVLGLQVRFPITVNEEFSANKNQWASSYGINVIPYDKLQRYVSGIDLRSAVQDNMAFKLSFGATFAMSAIMHF
jgi:hypothetical protein